jgi:hypothetical protein
VACKGINDIQIRKSTFALDKKLQRAFGDLETFVTGELKSTLIEHPKAN